MDLGLNQKQAVAILYAISATLGLAAVVLTTNGLHPHRTGSSSRC